MDLLSLLGLIATLLFGILAIHFYFKSKRETKLVVATESTLFFATKHDDLKVLYRGEPVSSLGRSLVLLVNAGTEAIVKSQIPPTEPLAIRFDESLRLLSYELVHVSNSSTGFELSPPQLNEEGGGGHIPVSFHHLNPQNGAVVELYFDCLESRSAPVKIDGVIINGRIESSYSPVHDAVWPVGMLGLMAFVLGVLFTLNRTGSMLAEAIGVHVGIALAVIITATIIIFVVAFRSILWLDRRLNRLPEWAPRILSQFRSSEVVRDADGGPPLSDRHH